MGRVQGNPSNASIQAQSLIHHFINNEADIWISIHLTPVDMSQLVPNLGGSCVQPCKVLMAPTQSLVHMLRLMMIHIHEEVREGLSHIIEVSGNIRKGLTIRLIKCLRGSEKETDLALHYG